DLLPQRLDERVVVAVGRRPVEGDVADRPAARVLNRLSARRGVHLHPPHADRRLAAGRIEAADDDRLALEVLLEPFHPVLAADARQPPQAIRAPRLTASWICASSSWQRSGWLSGPIRMLGRAGVVQPSPSS